MSAYLLYAAELLGSYLIGMIMIFGGVWAVVNPEKLLKAVGVAAIFGSLVLFFHAGQLMTGFWLH